MEVLVLVEEEGVVGELERAVVRALDGEGEMEVVQAVGEVWVQDLVKAEG